MTKGVRILVSSLLLVLLCTVGTFWLAADQLLNGVVRNWLTAQVSTTLEAQVQLEKLVYVDGKLRLSNLLLSRPGEFQLKIVAIDVRFTWSGLLQRRIDELTISQPQLVWTAPPAEAKTETASIFWPQTAPMQIDSWQLKDGRVELNWGDRQFLFDLLEGAGGLGPSFPLLLTSRCGQAPGVSLRLAGSARWEAGLALTLDELSLDEKNLLFRPVTISPGTEQTFGAQLKLARLDGTEVSGLFSALDLPLPWPKDLHWQVLEPSIDFQLLSGLIEAKLQTGSGFVQMADQRYPWQALRMKLKGDASQLELDGSVKLAGSSVLDLTASWTDQRLNGRWSATVANPADLGESFGITLPTSPFRPQNVKLHGQIEASLEAARVDAANLDVELGELGRLSAEMKAEWRDESLIISSASLRLTSRGGASKLAEAAISLRGDLNKSTWAGEWSLHADDGARLARSGGVVVPPDLPALLGLSLKGGVHYAAGDLGLTGVDLAGRLEGAGCSGLLHGGLAVTLGPDKEPVITLKAMSLDNLDYQSEDGMSGLVGGKLVLNGKLVLGEKSLGFDLSGQVAAVEALVGSWYGRLDKLPVSFSTKGNWARSNQQLALTGADIDLAGLVHGHFSGSYTEEGATLRAHIDVPQLQGDFQGRFHELIGELWPELSRVSLGGRLVLDGVVQQTGENRSLDLSVMPAEVSVAWGDDTRIEGLTGILPVQLSQPPAAPVEPGKISHLSWSRLQGGLLDSGPGKAALVASPNHWRLQKPLELAVGGGKVRLTALKLELLDLVPQLTASLELHDIALLQLSRQLEWPDMSGSLNANLAEIHVAGDEIRTVGAAAIQIFGGDFSINNMRVETPFSRFPTYHADIDFSGVDLYQLTNTFEFGEMNGIADGYIHELRLFNGTPSTLHAKLETRSKGERNISVKAIRNLNTLSQGGLSAALSQGLYQFIDFYRYSKIGLLCSLQNDLFHLEGTGRADSKHYLIYGGLLPPRIDVTVSSPTVSFKEMVRRLKRIERAER